MLKMATKGDKKAFSPPETFAFLHQKQLKLFVAISPRFSCKITALISDSLCKVCNLPCHDQIQTISSLNNATGLSEQMLLQCILLHKIPRGGSNWGDNGRKQQVIDTHGCMADNSAQVTFSSIRVFDYSMYASDVSILAST